MKSEKLKNALSVFKTKAKANSPRICLVAGIIAGAGAIVLTAKAGMDTHRILDERKARIHENEEAFENQGFEEPYTEEDLVADNKVENKRAILQLMKTYAPAVGLYLVSMILIVEGQKVLEKRNSALSTAVAAGQAAMAGYRNRVASFVGEETENDIYNGARKVKKEVVNEETGEVEVEEEIVMDKPTNYFSRCFDEYNPFWKKNSFDNRVFLTDVNRYLNEMLVARASGHDKIGFVTLNEVYKALGFEETPEGMILGWYYIPGAHETTIEFGLNNTMDEGVRLFMNGFERNVWLNFNFDGNVYDFLKKRNIESFNG